MHPKVHTAFERGDIIKLVAIFAQNSVTKIGRVDCQAHNPVLGIVQIQNDGLGILLVRVFPVLLILLFFLVPVLLLIGILFQLLLLLIESQLLLIHTELLVCLQVEEHDVDILLGSPTAMAAVTGPVAEPYHGLAVQYPFGIAVSIAALGQIEHLSVAGSVDECHVHIVPSAYEDTVGQNPLAVRRPLVPLVTVLIGVLVLAVHNSPHLLGVQIDDTDGGPVLQESDLLAVRPEKGLE